MIKLITLTVFLFGFSAIAMAQNSTEENPDSALIIAEPMLEENHDPVFRDVETMPQFTGGSDSLVSFLIKNLRYPEVDKTAGKEGKVYLSFIVEKDGRITMIRPVGKFEEMATPAMVYEAMRVVRSMPLFEPGMHGGKTERCIFLLPIVFNL